MKIEIYTEPKSIDVLYYKKIERGTILTREFQYIVEDIVDGKPIVRMISNDPLNDDPKIGACHEWKVPLTETHILRS